MKSLFFVAVAFGIFSGTIDAVKAQSSYPSKELEKKKPVISLKFIDNIEITWGKVSLVYKDVAIPEQVPQNSLVSIDNKGQNAYTIESCNQLQFKYALLTESDVESITNIPLFAMIEDWWGTRYSYGGTNKSGIDCSAFTGKLLANVYNITAPRTANEQYEMCNKVDSADLLEGDLVFFNTSGGVSHVGMYLGNNYFVHSSVQLGVTVSNMANAYYNKKFISGGRLQN